jgi:predicted PolB exonuclease-like 3'-5' exonuclease
MLKNGIHDRIWFYDLEWVPDAMAARRLCELPEGATERDAFEALWKRAGANESRPMPFLKYLFSRVVSIAFLSRCLESIDGETQVVFRLHSLPEDPAEEAGGKTESILLSKFFHYVGERKPQLVGYNSLNADIRVLMQRAMVNDIEAKEFNLRPDKPWEGRDYYSDYGEWHLDIMKLISGGGNNFREIPSLNELAKMCGFPGKLDVDGLQVADLWLAGELPKIIAYNEIDALNTYLVWLRLAHFCGFFEDPDYAAEQENFYNFLLAESQKPTRAHIKDFLAKWEY